MNTKHPKRRFWPRILLGLFILLVLPFVVPWSRINCRTDEIDIRSGQIRHTRFVYWFPISRRVVSSPISRALGSSAPQNTAEWRVVNTLSPGIGYSPHHSFHGAIAQIRFLTTCWELGQFTPAARRESASRVLSAWQQGNNDHPARGYLDTLSELTHVRYHAQQREPIDLQDLPR